MFWICKQRLMETTGTQIGSHRYGAYENVWKYYTVVWNKTQPILIALLSLLDEVVFFFYSAFINCSSGYHAHWQPSYDDSLLIQHLHNWHWLKQGWSEVKSISHDFLLDHSIRYIHRAEALQFDITASTPKTHGSCHPTTAASTVISTPC